MTYPASVQVERYFLLITVQDLFEFPVRKEDVPFEERVCWLASHLLYAAHDHTFKCECNFMLNV